jgi:hypothetical protein
VTRLVFVEDPSQVPAARPDTRIVVLDAAWTPEHARPDVLLARSVVAEVIDEVDLVESSLAALDAWAVKADIPDRLTADGVTWWPQVRMLLRWDVHELHLWRHVLDRLMSADRVDEVIVPAGRPRLVEAARAPHLAQVTRGASRPEAIRVRGGPGRLPRTVRWLARRMRRRWPRLSAIVRGWLRGFSDLQFRRLPEGRPGLGRRGPNERLAFLDQRYAELRRGDRAAIVVAWPRAFHVIHRGDRELRVDPLLSPAVDRLVAAGRPVVTVGYSLDHRVDADWPVIEADPTLLPESFLEQRWSRPLDAVGVTGGASRPARSGQVPLAVGDRDLGPAVARLVDEFAGSWLRRQRQRLRWADGLIADLRPGVLFTDREASRIAWLEAARRHGVPTVAIQHGMVYPNSPEYWRPGTPSAVRPDTTCVFGAWERDLLVGQAGFAPSTVVVTGSPRWDPETAPLDGSARAAVRHDLGVAPDQRLLLVSVAHNPLMGELHTFAALARVLGGPLPGVHLVIKLHPQDEAESRHEAFLVGLARAGGYAAPPMTVVRDMDVYVLLRAADAHLGQYSTVLTDAVVAGTPNMIIVGQAHADVLGYVAAGVATPVSSVAEVRAFMADPRPPQPSARRRFLDAHFRGGDASGRIVDVLIAAIDAGRGAPAGASTGPRPTAA